MTNKFQNQISQSAKKQVGRKKTYSSGNTQPDNKKATILIVDDQPSMITFVTAFLQHEGYRVLSAFSVAEGKKILQSNLDIGLILTDLKMPEEDGYEILNFVNKHIRFSHIPVIVVTSYSDPEAVMKALKLGAKDYLAKPYTSEVLIQRVRRILEQNAIHILLVISDEVESKILQRTLKTDSVNLVVKTTGSDACAEIAQNNFDIIISDMILKDMTGIELLKQITDYGIMTPTLLLENHECSMSEDELKKLGGYGFIRKPFNNTEIENIIKRLVGEY